MGRFFCWGDFHHPVVGCNPFERISQIGSSPQGSGWRLKSLKPPPTLPETNMSREKNILKITFPFPSHFCLPTLGNFSKKKVRPKFPNVFFGKVPGVIKTSHVWPFCKTIRALTVGAWGQHMLQRSSLPKFWIYVILCPNSCPYPHLSIPISKKQHWKLKFHALKPSVSWYSPKNSALNPQKWWLENDPPIEMAEFFGADMFIFGDLHRGGYVTGKPGHVRHHQGGLRGC